MAKNTKIALRNSIMYSIYVRNHGAQGSFREVEKDLPRIKSLGVDIIWLMPIHPIGELNRKGSLGCPYAIKDYRELNPEYGSLEDFKSLLEHIHSLDMKCIIDVVYNHTSPDSWLVHNHPEFFYKKPDGNRGNRVGEWTDIVDLDYSNRELWDYQIETLKYWIGIGVDGFRCDVASMVPLDFWLRARAEAAKFNKEILWLAESVHPHFLREMRKQGFSGHSDGELYNAFDITYDYDVNVAYHDFHNGKGSLQEYIKLVAMQEEIYPENYIKLRFLENHDQPRAKALIPKEEALWNWTAFAYFQKGCTLLYAGQEAQDGHTPSLFDIDKVDWSQPQEGFTDFLKRLAAIKKKELLADGFYEIRAEEQRDIIVASYSKNNRQLWGVFNMGLEEGSMQIEFFDGEYINLIDNSPVVIKNRTLQLQNKPIIIESSR